MDGISYILGNIISLLFVFRLIITYLENSQEMLSGQEGCFITKMLYKSEAWKLYAKNLNKEENMKMRFLRTGEGNERYNYPLS